MKQLCIAVAATAVFALPARAQANWSTYGGSDWNQRWSTLTQINTSNVKQLVPRMVFQTGTSRLGSFENTPIVVDGKMYVTTPNSEAVMAYDLRTKKQIWRQEPKVGSVIVCCGPVNRGVAIAGGTVFVGTLDARLLAFDAQTGDAKWDVQVADPSLSYSITMAPLVVGDNVLVGVSGGEYGIRGHLTAYNISTGKQVWRWFSIPAPGEDPVATNGWWGTWATKAENADLHRDIAKEKADSAKYPDAWKRGGGGVWTTPAYDKASNTIFVTVGNPSPDLDGTARPGADLFTDAISAVSFDAEGRGTRIESSDSPLELHTHRNDACRALALVLGAAVKVTPGGVLNVDAGGSHDPHITVSGASLDPVSFAAIVNYL